MPTGRSAKRSSTTPSAPTSSTQATTASGRGTPAASIEAVASAPSIETSPCAKLTMLVTL
ncbi:Uncharacterised protein [Bordetella pertussis]|nr:Uncharacterised protein [Bordetella pertussis]